MDENWKFVGRAAMVLGIVLVLGQAGAHAEDTLWTRSTILAVADEEATRLGYDIEHMSVSFNTYNSKWRDYLASAQNFVPVPKVQEKLKDREYWAVYYAPPKRGMRGGNLWVFLDRETGEIITVGRGQ